MTYRRDYSPTVVGRQQLPVAVGYGVLSQSFFDETHDGKRVEKNLESRRVPVVFFGNCTWSQRSALKDGKQAQLHRSEQYARFLIGTGKVHYSVHFEFIHVFTLPCRASRQKYPQVPGPRSDSSKLLYPNVSSSWPGATRLPWARMFRSQMPIGELGNFTRRHCNSEMF